MKLFTGYKKVFSIDSNENTKNIDYLIFYVGDISDQWENFVSINYKASARQQKISNFNEVNKI